MQCLSLPTACPGTVDTSLHVGFTKLKYPVVGCIAVELTLAPCAHGAIVYLTVTNTDNGGYRSPDRGAITYPAPSERAEPNVASGSDCWVPMARNARTLRR